MIATRGPAGSGWPSSARAASSSSCPDPTSTIPACRNTPRQIALSAASAAVCDDAARAPASDRPVLTTTTGRPA